jgi:hypothetical protein
MTDQRPICILYIDEKDNVYVNVKKEDGSALRYTLETPSKCMIAQGCGYSTQNQAQLSILRTILCSFPNSGLACNVEYSPTLKKMEGNLCTITFQCEEVYLVGTMKFRFVIVENLVNTDGCFPYNCFH